MIYGYARVSSPGQDPERQDERLKDAGCEEIVTEKASAADGRKRSVFARLLARMVEGDTLIVTDLDRFARSARDGLNFAADLRGKGIDFKSLEQPWADTTTDIGQFVLTIYLAVAEWDRKRILARTSDGRKAAQRRGVKMGRKPKLTPKQRAFVLQERATPGGRSAGELAQLLKVSRDTIKRVKPDDGAPIGPASFLSQIDIEEILGARLTAADLAATF